MATALPVFPSFDVTNSSSLGPRWEKYLSRLENLLVAMDITDPDRKKALLLHFIGPDCYDIFETLTLAVNTVNTEYEKYIFRNAKHQTMNLTTLLSTA